MSADIYILFGINIFFIGFNLRMFHDTMKRLELEKTNDLLLCLFRQMLMLFNLFAAGLSTVAAISLLLRLIGLLSVS